VIRSAPTTYDGSDRIQSGSTVEAALGMRQDPWDTVRISCDNILGTAERCRIAV